MCGVIGLQFSDDVKKDEILYWIKNTFRVSGRRGKDSSGISLLFVKNNINQIYTFRSEQSCEKLINYTPLVDLITNKIKKNFKLRFIISQTRLATNGDTINENNQPIKSPKKKILYVFNGIITNSEKIKKKFKISKKFKNDGIALSIIDEKYSNIKYLEGAYSFIKMSVDTNPKISFMTNNGSLYVSNNLKKNLKTLIMSEESFFKQLHVENYNQVKKNKLFEIKTNDVILNSKIFVEKNILQQNHKVKVFNVIKPKISKKLEHKIRNRINLNNYNINRCKKCVLPNTHPFILFDEKGVCNFCNNEKKLKLKNKKIFLKKLLNIRKRFGDNKILLALSGGRDSSYALHILSHELGFKPRTYTYDWGLNTDLARRNVSIMTGKLGIENIIIAANLRKKREYVKKNINAWLRKPHLGIVPLFMAGDKQFISNAKILKNEIDTKIEIFAANLHEVTQFKEEFSGIQMWKGNSGFGESMKVMPQLKLLLFYGIQFLKNTKYLNNSLLDSFNGFLNYYHAGVNKIQIYDYFDWDEDVINNVLINKYGWETANDTTTTWRIGDGTAAFYNFIYLIFAGFTENDVIRSNLIRQGKLTRKKAINLIKNENIPRYSTLNWYFKLFDLDFSRTINTIIDQANKLKII